MSDVEIVQDLFNTFGIHGTLALPVDMQSFLSGAAGLRDLGPKKDTDPKHIKQCIDKMYMGLGPVYFKQLFDSPPDVDDLWTHYWCPQPAGTELHKANCPAGTHPLWTNGTATVFVRPHKDQHGNDVFDFGVC